MNNFKKIFSVLTTSAVIASAMANVASAKTIMNGMKFFDDDFYGAYTLSGNAHIIEDAENVYSGEKSFSLRYGASATVEYDKVYDLSSLKDNNGTFSFWCKAEKAVQFEVSIYDADGKRFRYFFDSAEGNAWTKFECALNKPTTWVGYDADTDFTRINKIAIGTRDWENVQTFYFDDFIIGSETKMPGVLRDKVVRVIYDDAYDGNTYNRQSSGFDVDVACTTDVYDGEASISLTAKGEGWRQILAGGKSLDLSAVWENAYLELYIKASTDAAFNIRPTYDNGVEGDLNRAVTVDATWGKSYVCTPSTEGFTKVSIPMTTFTNTTVNQSAITGFSIQGGAANNDQTIYVDKVQYIVKEEVPSLSATMANGVVTVTTSAETGKIVVAVYNGTEFAGLKIVDAPATEPSVNVEIGELTEGQNVKVMLFDGLDKITPLTNCVSL